MQRNEKDLGAGRGESVFLIGISTSNREGCQPLKMKYDKDIYYKKKFIFPLENQVYNPQNTKILLKSH